MMKVKLTNMRRSNSFARAIIMLCILVMIGAGGIYIFMQVQRDLAPEDSGALYGGELEFGYPFAGYMIAYNTTGGTSICSMTYLSQNLAVTAAHCTNDGATVWTGVSGFSADSQDNVQASQYTTKPGWDFKTSFNDLSVVRVDSSKFQLGEYARISPPNLGCNYKVVAYGRTEDESSINLQERLRKSATMCITDIERDVFYIEGSGGGICFGDSGSAIFEADTNRLVGIISAIVASEKGQSARCAIDNRAIVVRVDRNLPFISQFTPSIASLVDQTTINCLDANCTNIATTAQTTQASGLIDQFTSSVSGDYPNLVSRVLQRQVSDEDALLIGVFSVAAVVLLIMVIYSLLAAPKSTVSDDYYYG